MSDRHRIVGVLALGAFVVLAMAGCAKPDPGVTDDDLRPLTVTVLPWTESHDELTYDVGQKRFGDSDDLEDYLRENLAAVSRVDVVSPEGRQETLAEARRLVEDVLPRFNVPAELVVKEMELPEKPKRGWFKLF